MDNLRAADRLAARFGDIFEELSYNPNIGTRRERYGPGLRAFVMRPYILYYRIMGQQLVVMRVIHGARDQKNIQFGEQ